jgi:hypothetical protein
MVLWFAAAADDAEEAGTNGSSNSHREDEEETVDLEYLKAELGRYLEKRQQLGADDAAIRYV